MFFSFQLIVDGAHMEFGVSAPKLVAVEPGRVLEELNKRQQMGECLAWVKLKEQWNVIRRPAQVRKFSFSDFNWKDLLLKIYLPVYNIPILNFFIHFINKVDCEWGEFGEWGLCSQSCDEGIQTRVRKVIQDPQFGGVLCTGYSTESRTCNLQACPGKYNYP